jgi:hypothetical protein
MKMMGMRTFLAHVWSSGCPYGSFSLAQDSHGAQELWGKAKVKRKWFRVKKE